MVRVPKHKWASTVRILNKVLTFLDKRIFHIIKVYNKRDEKSKKEIHLDEEKYAHPYHWLKDTKVDKALARLISFIGENFKPETKSYGRRELERFKGDYRESSFRARLKGEPALREVSTLKMEEVREYKKPPKLRREDILERRVLETHKKDDKITSTGCLDILRYIAKKEGEINQKTCEYYLRAEEEKKALHQLVEAGWVNERGDD